MKTKAMETIRTGMKVGALLGGVAFLIFGIVPGFHYGGYGTLMILSKIANGPLEFTILTRIVVILGVLIGILCLGFMSIVVGSIFGTVAGYAVNMFSPAPETGEETGEQTR